MSLMFDFVSIDDEDYGLPAKWVRALEKADLNHRGDATGFIEHGTMLHPTAGPRNS